MPKGSKKRKAEKRKKEKQANITSPTNSAQGSEDLKSQSDSGEVNFSSSNNTDARQSRLGHEVVGSEAVSKSRSIERSEKEKEVGEVTRDLLVQKEKQTEGGGGDYVKETSSDSGSYSGSSSDDESEAIEKTKEEEEVVEVITDLSVQKEKLTEGGDSVKRIVNIESVNDSVKETFGDASGRSSSNDESEAIEKNKDEIDLVTETTAHADLIEKIVSISEDVEIIEFNMGEKTGDSGVIDLPSKEAFQVGGGDVSSCESSNGYEHHKEATVTENSINKPETAPSSGEKSNGYEHEFEATSPEISEKQHLPVTPLSSEDTNESKHRDEATTAAISDNQQAASSTLSSEVSGPYEHHTETTTPEIADKKIASAPPTVQPTSWKSCCGLFDVFMGSNR